MSDLDEYLRRNIQVAKAHGALAAAKNSLTRSQKLDYGWRKKWLEKNLQDIIDRVEPLIAELTAHRDELKDATNVHRGD